MDQMRCILYFHGGEKLPDSSFVLNFDWSCQVATTLAAWIKRGVASLFILSVRSQTILLDILCNVLRANRVPGF